MLARPIVVVHPTAVIPVDDVFMLLFNLPLQLSSEPEVSLTCAEESDSKPRASKYDGLMKGDAPRSQTS
jgi:hypothetical protein